MTTQGDAALLEVLMFLCVEIICCFIYGSVACCVCNGRQRGYRVMRNESQDLLSS